MAYLFSYTECEAPGPFQNKAGFKIKSFAALDGAAPNSEIERLLNITVANFPAFQAPKVDAYATREEFLGLPKVWSYQAIVDGHFAFSRLATSGVKMDRPGNPFHQGFVVKYTELNNLINQAAETSGLSNLTPADLYFWEWPTPRGDAEVEAAQYLPDEVPIPRLSELDLSERWERVFSITAGVKACRAFEAKWLSSQPQLALLGDEEFFSLMSLLLRLIPLEFSWAIPIGNSLPSGQSPDSAIMAGFFATQHGSDDSSEQSVFWTDLVEQLVENGIQLELIPIVQDLAKFFRFSIQNQREALAFLPLACLVLPDPDGFFRGLGIHGLAWQVLQDVGIRLDYRSVELATQFQQKYLSGLDFSALPPEAESWIKRLEAR